MDTILSKICQECGWKTENIRKQTCGLCGSKMKRHEVIPSRPKSSLEMVL